MNLTGSRMLVTECSVGNSMRLIIHYHVRGTFAVMPGHALLRSIFESENAWRVAPCLEIERFFFFHVCGKELGALTY